MKVLLTTTLFVLDVLGNPLLRDVARFTQSLKPQCVVANDLVCPRSDVTFWLYTRSTQNDPTQLDIDTLDSVPWVDGPLKFIIHGYSVDKDTAVNAVLRPAYFAFGEYNIISLDWSPLCREGCYIQAIGNIPTVAKCVAEFFNKLTETHQFSSVHLLGHSLGAHVAARASNDIKELQRLTKFDVANPLFNKLNSENGTAGFIDVYHSNCDIYGQRMASGFVDVYFNDNTFQPGCGCDTSCSHLRAVEFYAASIGGGPLKAFPCGGWPDYRDGKCKVPTSEELVVAGEDADTKARGVFLTFTSAQPPYLLEDHFFTDEASFKGFKEKVAGECPVSNFRDFLYDLY